MKCKRAEDLILSEYAEGRLKGRDLEELNGHIDNCPSCRELAGGVISAGKTLRSSGRQAPPDFVWQRVQDKLSARQGIFEVFEDFLDALGYGLYRLKPAVVATATIVVLVFVLAAARMISEHNYYAAFSAREEIVSMISLNGDNSSAEYEIGTSAEDFFL